MKKIYMKSIIAFLPSIPLYFFWMYMLSNPVQILGFISYFYFLFSLLVSPVSYIFLKFSSLKKCGIFFVLIRRQLWILAWIFALAHMFKVYERIIGMYQKFFSESQGILEFLLSWLLWKTGSIFWINSISFWLWSLSLVVVIFLAMISNNYSQKFLWVKLWKRIQMCVYPLFLLIVLHIYFGGWWKELYMYPALLLIIARWYVFIDKKRK